MELVARLVGSSREAVTFLEDCGVDLSKVVRLGGHSIPRTRSNPTGPNVGFALIKAVSSKVQALPSVSTITNAKVTKLQKAASPGQLTVAYTVQTKRGSGQEQVVSADAVILATGGFAANKELLQKYAPETAHLPTTNGDWATGDGLDLGESLGAALVHVDQVQVHPTGFVDPADPNNLTKWLAPEKLRGCGAVLLSPAGHRFVDELTTRDKVSAAINALPGKRCWLLLGQVEAEMFGEATLGFYAFKKMISKFETLEAAAKHMAVAVEVLQEEVAAYGDAVSGKSADALGKQEAGKGPFYVALVTPVVHYCMGGLAINDKAQVLDKSGAVVPGLFAAGEVSGGLHGKNRLGGNSLAECAVFGRVAGQQAASLVLGGVGPAAAAKVMAATL